MRHDITVSSAGITLRPVRLEDAAEIVIMRSDPVQSRFVHAVSPVVDDQVLWLTRYLARSGDFYFVVERSHDGRFEGTVGLYDLADDKAEFGRWFLKPGSLAAPASAMLIYHVAFEELGLSEVYCRTVEDNKAVISFHEAYGARRARVIQDAFVLRDRPVAAIEHRVSSVEWPRLRSILEPHAARAERIIVRGACQASEC